MQLPALSEKIRRKNKMGKFARKIFINQIKQIDKEKKQGCKSAAKIRTGDIHRAMQKVKTDKRISPEDAQEAKDLGRGHALWIHMLTLKKEFKFTGKMLVEFREHYNHVFECAIDSEKDGAAKCIKNTVMGNPKEDSGNFGYTDFSQYEFDADGRQMDNVEARYGRRSMSIYLKFERCFDEFNKAEVVTMLVLFDYYGFRIKRLKRFIHAVRKAYAIKPEDSLAVIPYLEKLCKTTFSEFDPIRRGQGIKVQA